MRERGSLLDALVRCEGGDYTELLEIAMEKRVEILGKYKTWREDNNFIVTGLIPMTP